MSERPTYADLVLALVGVASQHLYDTPNGAYHDGGLSANEDVIDVLCRVGVMKRDHHRPDMEWYRFDIVALGAITDAPTSPTESIPSSQEDTP